MPAGAPALLRSRAAFDVRALPEAPWFEHSSEPAHNRFEQQRAVLRAALQAEHAAALQAQQQHYNLHLKQAAGAIMHLQVQLADAQVAQQTAESWRT